jgi:hypothetical protein
LDIKNEDLKGITTHFLVFWVKGGI